MERIMSAGYDTPIDSEEDDVLGRASFAREIARLAGSSPQRWGVRIGVYGRWGEGKSSVLNMIERQLQKEGHLVAKFNPWGCTTAEEMMEILADSLVLAAETQQRQVEGKKVRKAKKLAKEVAQAGASLGMYGAGWSQRLARWAKDRKDDIERVIALIGDDRLIVLVDDVDRVDPKVLPKLFFALHEVLASPGLSFILALDPEVVGAALAEYHAGFKGGAEFLGKIVQFPLWLPEPSDEALRLLAQRDREQFAPFLDPAVLAQEASLLPTNPRELRAFVRGLWRLEAEVARHDPDEIDQHLLVIVEALRQQSPELLRELLRDEEFIRLGTAALVRPEQREEYTQKVRKLVDKARVRDADRAVQLVRALSGRSLLWIAEKIRYHALIGERPHAVTWKEFRELLAFTGEADRAEWVRAHTSRRDVGQREVGDECILCCVMGYRKELDEAADTQSESAHRAEIDAATKILDLLDWLWFRDEGGIQARSRKLFFDFLGVCRQWEQFNRNDGDKQLRERERKLLLRMAQEASSPLDYLEELAPWDRRMRLRPSELTDAVLNELEGRAAPEVFPVFKKPSGIWGCLLGARVSEGYLLVRRSPMWNEGRKAALSRLVDQANESVAENCRTLLEAITEPEQFHLSGRTDAHHDRELLQTLWRGACAVPVQVRFFRGLAELRERLGKLLGEPPREPTWWDRVRQLVEVTPTDG